MGKPIEVYGNVKGMPKLGVFEVSSGLGQHWQTELDEGGVLGPDGQPVVVESHVKGGNKERLNVIFDTGFSFPQVPQ